MRGSPTVTVLASVHNSGTSVDRMIDSILGQTFTDFEFLVIDDGSSDGSADILRDRARQDCRLQILTNEQNLGLAASLNRGLRAARGEWVARIDADDEALPHRLARQLDFVRRNPDVDVVGGWIVVRQRGTVTGVRKVPENHHEIVRLLYSCPLYHPTVMYRRERVLEVGAYDPALRRRQDLDLWFRCAHHGFRFANIPEPLTIYSSKDFFGRNTLDGALIHAWVALRGCRLVGSSPVAYFGSLLPVARFLVPPPLRALVARFYTGLDPRERAARKPGRST
jgi:glycosyltransferase involved in cell wall biosynthesis